MVRDIKPEKLFHYNGLTIGLHNQVYDPAEDSFLLLDTLSFSEEESVFEVGTGCGLLAIEACRQGAVVVCSDINPYAVQITHHNIQQNKQNLHGRIQVREGDLFSVLTQSEKFDTIVFNPPYLPISNKETINRWIDTATNGGKDGLAVTKRFLKEVGDYLKPDGCAYFVFSSLSKKTKLHHILQKMHLSYETVASQHFLDESLEIYRIQNIKQR